jgi:hypothetical protein
MILHFTTNEPVVVNRENHHFANCKRERHQSSPIGSDRIPTERAKFFERFHFWMAWELNILFIK